MKRGLIITLSLVFMILLGGFLQTNVNAATDEITATWNATDKMNLEDSITIKLSRPLKENEKLVFLCNYSDVNNNAYSISWKMSDSHKKYIKQIDETTYTFKIEEAIKTCMSDGEFAEGGRTCSKHINYWN